MVQFDMIWHITYTVAECGPDFELSKLPYTSLSLASYGVLMVNMYVKNDKKNWNCWDFIIYGDYFGYVSK